ncbi:hypothetical protein NOCA2110002 [metagenome]|uniref:Uncharacterized protein n=1 Tax=metagenome TaxID=256318 RepID=A0A2P2BW20_9ZZZZ
MQTIHPRERWVPGSSSTDFPVHGPGLGVAPAQIRVICWHGRLSGLGYGAGPPSGKLPDRMLGCRLRHPAHADSI